MPGFSVLRVEVEGKHDWPVRVWQEDGDDLIRRTGDTSGSRARHASPQGEAVERSLGDYAVEFRPLEPGSYMVQPDDVDNPVAVELTGLDAVWVSFRQRVQPISPHLVRPLLGSVGHGLGDAVSASSARPGHEFESDYYLFIGRGMLRTTQLTELLDNVIVNQVPYGMDVQRAKAAERVLVVGTVDDELLARLGADGANVMQLNNV